MAIDLAFQYLKKKIIAKGANCEGYKDEFLKRRLEARMRSVGLKSYAEYARLIDKNPFEFNDLLDALTINVSEFFRDITVWNVLRRCVLQPMLREKLASGSRELRIWSAGCADGEEAYTVTLLVLETLAYLSPSFKIEILGTDIDQPSLIRARRGVYATPRLRLVSRALLHRYFKPGTDGTSEIVGGVKKFVTFKSHDLSTSPPAFGFDIITCRNVIIYFSKELQRRLLRSFHDALIPGGYLVLGKVETIGEASSLFTCTDLAERIYRRPPEPHVDVDLPSRLPNMNYI